MPPPWMEKFLYVIMITVLLSLKSFQRRSLQPRSRLQDNHLVAEIHLGASPVSSWVESQPTTPLYLHSSLNSSFFFPCQNKESCSYVYTTGILMFNRHNSPPHPQVHCFDTSFLEAVLYCFYCLFILTGALYVFVCVWFKVRLCPCSALDLLRKGIKITFIISTNDAPTLTLLQQHKL